MESMTFGRFIRAKRDSIGLSLRGLAAELGITPAFLCDMEKGNKFPAEKNLPALIRCLHISTDELSLFYDLFSRDRNKGTADLNGYLAKNDVARAALRKARDSNIPDEMWVHFLEYIEEGGGWHADQLPHEEERTLHPDKAGH